MTQGRRGKTRITHGTNVHNAQHVYRAETMKKLRLLPVFNNFINLSLHLHHNSKPKILYSLSLTVTLILRQVHKMTKQNGRRDWHDRGLGKEVLRGLWFLVQMTQQHPGAPGPKKQWLQCAGNIDTTCPPFLPSPARYCSLSPPLVHWLCGREQGMLITGCENRGWRGGGASSGYRGRER